MKSAFCLGLAAALLVPPPPPPEDAELPGVDEEGSVDAESGPDADTEAGAGDGSGPESGPPEAPGDEATSESGVVGAEYRNEFGVSAAALEPAERPKLDADPDVAARGHGEVTERPRPVDDGDLDLDPYARDDRPKETNPGRGLRIAGYTLNGAGVVVGVAALVYVARGAGARNDLDEAKTAGNTSKRVDAIDRVETADRNAIILGATAGALLVVGSSLYFAGLSKKRNAYARTTVAPALTQGGGGLVLKGRF